MIIAMISIIHANQVACSAWWFFGSNVSTSLASSTASHTERLWTQAFNGIHLPLHDSHSQPRCFYRCQPFVYIQIITSYYIQIPSPAGLPMLAPQHPARPCGEARPGKWTPGGSLGRRQLRWTCWNDDEKICVYHTYVVHYMHNSIHLISSYQFISYMTLNDIDILLTYKIL